MAVSYNNKGGAKVGKHMIYEIYRIMPLDGMVIYKSKRTKARADKLTAIKGTQFDEENRLGHRTAIYPHCSVLSS